MRNLEQAIKEAIFKEINLPLPWRLPSVTEAGISSMVRSAAREIERLLKEAGVD